MIGNAIRTDEWRYVEWRDLKTGEVKHRELYDHRSHSRETENIAEKNPKKIEELAKQLSKVLPAQEVVLRRKFYSKEGGKRAKITWRNEHDGPVGIAWINPLGQRQGTQKLAAGASRNIGTFTGHVFAIESMDGTYHEHLTIEASEGTYTLSNAAKKKR